MLFYLITYDIHCNKRRKKVSDLLEGYGQRVQYSVFECILLPQKYKELKHRLLPHIDAQTDSLRFYPLSAHTLGSVDVWGGAPMTQKAKSTVAQRYAQQVMAPGRNHTPDFAQEQSHPDQRIDPD